MLGGNTKPMTRTTRLVSRKPWRTRRVPVAREAKQTTSLPKLNAIASALEPLPMNRAQPKFMYVEDVRLRAMCRGMKCQHCGAESDALGITWAHSNWAIHGKGKSIKASDVYVAALCAWCHADLDQGSKLTGEQRWRLWLDAWISTLTTALADGTWPKDLDLPPEYLEAIGESS